MSPRDWLVVAIVLLLVQALVLAVGVGYLLWARRQLATMLRE